MFSHTDSAFLMQDRPFCEWPLLVCTSTKRGEGGRNIDLRILAPLPPPHWVLFFYNNIVKCEHTMYY